MKNSKFDYAVILEYFFSFIPSLENGFANCNQKFVWICSTFA